jgi:hypothetical protein
MRKVILTSVVSVLLLAGAATWMAMASGADKVGICHITTGTIDKENNLCLALVIEVAPEAAAQHREHGDPPAPIGASPGDRLMVPCR